MFDYTLIGTQIFELLRGGASALVRYAPLWLPFFLLYVFFQIWTQYVRTANLATWEWDLLELKLPREISKSPAAMEVVLNALFQTGGEGNWYDKYWKGGMRPWFSLEMVSINGTVHFFVRTTKKLRGIVEAQLYSQYPSIEIQDAEDYANHIPYGENHETSLWGCEFVLTKSDPYPIKTYVDYGLDKDPKEEYKVDPMTPAIEFLGSLKQGEQLWIQILVRAHKDEKPKYKTLFHGIFSGDMELFNEKGLLGKKGPWRATTDKWKDDAKEEIKKIIKDATPEGAPPEKSGILNLTPGQKFIVEALERSITKPGFDVGIRGIYITEKDKFNPNNIGGLTGAFKQYNTNHLNGFRPNKTTSFDFPWQDPFKSRVESKKRKMVDAYRRRAFFHPPPNTIKLFSSKKGNDIFVLNSEELATIYHLPGEVATTPTLPRIESRKGEAPSNIPGLG